jgi:rubrerythrin
MSWSILKFSGEEIIEIALQMEESGILFYQKALTIAKENKLKDTLIYLAQEEEKHIQAFNQLGEQLKYHFVPNERYVGEYGDYIKSLVNSHIFKLTEVEDLIKEIKNDQDILRFAIGFEKDSIAIFQEFKNVANKAGADILEQLINEEKGHIKAISAFLHSK